MCSIRFGSVLIVLAIVIALFCASFGQVLFAERNFVYRDAGHFYYPYFKLIAQEWAAGRVPLWNPYENGGVPLAGNPTASVFYPLKLLFLLPYPVAYKWYLMGHVLIAWVVCTLSARGLGISWWGSALAGTAYAFSGFVIFQVFNIVFLCGAAWLPLGMLAVDRLVRRPRAGWCLTLAVVLALQVLGGDPQVAYLTGLAALPYALIYHLGLMRGQALLMALAAVGFGIVSYRRSWDDFVQHLRLGRVNDLFQRDLLYWLSATGLLLAGTLVLLIVSWRRRGSAPEKTVRSVRLLLLAGVVGFLLCAVQVLPTFDLLRVADRSAPQAPHESVAFSFFPLRLVEFLLPTPFGRQFPINTRWMPFQGYETNVWVPTVYLGLVPLLLGVFSLRLWGGTVEQRWLTWTTILMFWLAIGKFGGPLWLGEEPGRKDPVRQERGVKVYGTSDGLYRLCEDTIPGFRSFRYPAKMLVFCTLGIALLAGLGTDRLLTDPSFKLARTTLLLAVIGLVALGLVIAFRGQLLTLIATQGKASIGFGPFDATLAWWHLVTALCQLAVLSLSLWLLLCCRDRWPTFAQSGFPIAILSLLAADLYSANAWLILADEQAAIDAKPIVIRAIEQEEAKEPESRPYRVHRTAIYSPKCWRDHSNPERCQEMSRWERSTIQPKYGLPFGVQYTTTIGTMAIYDVEFFFGPWNLRQLPPPVRKRVNTDLIVYYPRRGFDLWNTKYFVIPKGAKLDDEYRGTFSFLSSSDGSSTPIIAESAMEEEDYLVLKNPESFPRAWVVHRADFRQPVRGLRREDRTVMMEQLLYQERISGLPLWEGVYYGDYPLSSQVMLEYDGREDLTRFHTGNVPTSEEKVHFETYESDRVRMRVRMQSAGFLVLADTYHSGWSATIDGSQPAPIVRANRAMRAVPVPAGEHVVELSYRSRPFEIGATLSVLTWMALAVWLAVNRLFARRCRVVGEAGCSLPDGDERFGQ